MNVVQPANVFTDDGGQGVEQTTTEFTAGSDTTGPAVRLFLPGGWDGAATTQQLTDVATDAEVALLMSEVVTLVDASLGRKLRLTKCGDFRIPGDLIGDNDKPLMEPPCDADPLLGTPAMRTHRQKSDEDLGRMD